MKMVIGFHPGVVLPLPLADAAESEDAAALGLDAENAALKEERDQLKAENDALKAQIAAADDEQVNTILDSAVSAGKIKEGDRETYRNLLKADRSSAVKVINSMKAGRRVGDDIKNPAPQDNLGPWEKRQNQIREKRAQR